MITQLFRNRELSWLSFNERVLQEAADSRVPLVERMRFLGIFSNNLDEFFRVRVATWRRIYDFPDPENNLREKAASLLQAINRIDFQQQKRFLEIYRDLLCELKKEKIFIINEKELTYDQGIFVRGFFRDQVRSNIFPVMVKSFKRSTFIKDRSIYLAIHMQKADGSIPDDFALVKVPSAILSRFLVLPKKGDENHIILLDDVIRYNLSEVFSIFDYDIFHAYTIKITRDAEMEVDNDVSKSLMERMSEGLKQRKKGRPVRFIYDENMPSILLKLLMDRLKISQKDNVVKGGRYHNFKDFMSFPNLGDQQLVYPPYPPLPHADLAGAKSIFSQIRERDIMLHFPYQSFQYIIDLLREASIDPAVRSIRMTLYRVAKNSNVINALINAARNGKKVSVYLELQARFDEAANIFWSEKLQEEGVNVIHGTIGMKVHSKLILIRRKENNDNVLYANIGTGNFNEATAKIYGDDSLLTSDVRITKEVEKVFSLFEKAIQANVDFQHLIVSPFETRDFILQNIDREIAIARQGKHAAFMLKLNSLVDEAVVRKIYEASNQGVKIKLIVRGICVLIPGLKNMSDNIEAISIVDRYLEHSRVFIFNNDGKPLYYLGSADMMARNLDHRIEVAVPIYDQNLQEELQIMLDIQWADNIKARKLGERDLNEYKPSDEPQIRSQFEIYNYFREKYYQKPKV